jgi:DNA-binding MarR family transcriptional regulator
VAARRSSAASRAGVADRLHSLAIHLLRAVRIGDDYSGLTAPRLSALSVITFKGPITLTELAVAEQVTAPTMTRLVQGLEAAGMVRRTTDARDRRAIRLSATAQGKRVLGAARKKRIGALQHLLADLEPDDIEAVEAALAALEPRVRTRLSP